MLLFNTSDNCRLNSNNLANMLHDGLPSSLHELLQEMGCIDRKMDASTGTPHYEVHISFISVIMLFMRIQCQTKITWSGSASTRKWEMMTVLKLLMDTKSWHHTSIEAYFKVNPDPNKDHCRKFHTSCNGAMVLHQSRRVYSSTAKS